MTKEELGWLHRLEARMEIEGLEVGQRVLKRLAESNRFLKGHQQMVTRSLERYQELSGAERRAACGAKARADTSPQGSAPDQRRASEGRIRS